MTLDQTNIACRAKTPVGIFTALYENGVISRVLFPDEPCPGFCTCFDDNLPFAEQVAEYFEGRRKSFSLPVLIPGTPFRQSVYRAVLDIPYGQTATYSDIALITGHPLAMRAVGTTMKLTPLPLLIPCHRVVHKSANADAYRGGLGIKSFLLTLEAKNK